MFVIYIYTPMFLIFTHFLYPTSWNMLFPRFALSWFPCQCCFIGVKYFTNINSTYRYSLLLQHEQLNKIYELCGTPDELTWPGVSKIPWYNKFKPTRQMKKRIRELFRQLSI